MKKTIFTLLFMFWTFAAEAKPIPELTAYLKQEIQNIDSSVSAGDSGGFNYKGEDYYLKNLLIRLRATFGIDVTWVAKFEIVPEVELVYLRDYPAGKEAYKP